MAVIAITRIQYGKSDGSVTDLKIGDTVSGLSEDEVKGLVLSGAAIETGKNRKYSVAPVMGEQDDETLKRDAIIAKAASDASGDDEAVTDRSDKAMQLQAAAQGAPAAPGGPAAVNTQPALANRTEAQVEAQNKAAEAAKDTK